MATATEISGLIDWIKERWPSASGFRHWERVARDFAMVPMDALWEAARGFYDAGNRTAPTFSELKREAVRIASDRGMTDPRSVGCDIKGHGNWAITDLGRTDADGHPLREAECVDCNTTIIRPAHKLLTVGELAEQQKRGREADPVTGIVGNLAEKWSEPDSDETDRIAP